MNILFICTGNTCRSPMAEGLFNSAASAAGLEHHAFSRGIFASDGAPASENAVRASAILGADISGHRAHRIALEDLEAADMVLCMTAAHIHVLEEEFPGIGEKASTLADGDISDPFGGGDEEYATAAGQIAGAVARLVKEL